MKAYIAVPLMSYSFQGLYSNVEPSLHKLRSNFPPHMRLFHTFFVWRFSLIAAVVIADWSLDGLSSNSIESPSEAGNSNQASRFDDGFGSDLIASTSTDCAPDSIQITAKLRARMNECRPPETSNDGNGKTPNPNDEEVSPDDGQKNVNDNGNGQHSPKYPDSWIWKPPLKVLPTPKPESSDLCPRTNFGALQFIICHDGPETEIHWLGLWIENAIWCMWGFLFFLCWREMEVKFYVQLMGSENQLQAMSLTIVLAHVGVVRGFCRTASGKLSVFFRCFCFLPPPSPD